MRFWKLAAAACLAAGAMAGVAKAAPKVGQPAPDFTVTTFGGNTVHLADLKGDVIVLNFWATWCGPCRKELPFLDAAFKQYNQYGFQVLAVATEDSVSERELKKLAAQTKIPFVKRMNGPYRIMKAVPTNYIIDRSGNLVYADAGALDMASFNSLIVPLLRQPIPEAASTQASAATPSAGQH